MRLTTITIVALLIAPITTNASRSPGREPGVARARYLMGTVCEVAAANAEDAEAAFEEGARIERMLSTWTDASELARVNRGDAEPSPQLRALLDETLAWSRRTGGAFNPRIKALVDLWRTRGEGAVPTREAIDAALASVGRAARCPLPEECRCCSGSGQRATGSAPGRTYTNIEEGGFGKGYALDRMLARIRGPRASIDFGGQIIVRGEQRVAIADPTDRDKPVVALTIANSSISTSSGSEKTFEVDGRRFSHLIDPRTGEALPPRGSVSVIARDALTADILSTAIYVMGDDGIRWADANDVCAIVIDSENNIRSSAPCREHVRGLRVIDRDFKVKD